MVYERVLEIAKYVLETGDTVRATAKHFNVSKSTVHKDLTVKLRYIHPTLYKQIREILEKNKAERHLRGGEATKKKYFKRVVE